MISNLTGCTQRSGYLDIPTIEPPQHHSTDLFVYLLHLSHILKREITNPILTICCHVYHGYVAGLIPLYSKWLYDLLITTNPLAWLPPSLTLFRRGNIQGMPSTTWQWQRIRLAIINILSIASRHRSNACHHSSSLLGIDLDICSSGCFPLHHLTSHTSMLRIAKWLVENDTIMPGHAF